MNTDAVSPVLDAGAIVGLLADGDRLRCVAALVLGAASLESVVDATDLSPAAAAKALGRLVDGGLVVTGDDGGMFVLGAAFSLAARAALSRPSSTEFLDHSAEHRKVLTAFVVDGRLTHIPVAVAKRRVVLDWLVQDFEVGRRYSEAMVNLILGRRHADTAALRRALVDDDLLDRDAGHYWRSGGTVPTSR